VSLILDALKKLEREKEASPTGVLVVGAVPWRGLRRRRPLLALAVATLLVLATVAIVTWWLSRQTPSAAGTPSRAAAPEATSAAEAASVTSGRAATPSAPPTRRLLLPEPAGPSSGPTAGAGEATPSLLQAEAPSRRGPQLNAISRQDGKPVAVIDGRLVREGDSIGGVHVLRIGETEVEVEVQGRRRTLRF
jgi:hypothetical protein